MKRRTKRDLSIFFGALVVIGMLAGLNTQFGRVGMRAEFEKLLLQLEAKEVEKGDLLLEWKYLRKTKGSLKRGGKYADEVLARDGDVTNIIGFMVPQNEFRDVTEFLLLPIPLECYFCSMPPTKDVMLVRMAPGVTTSINIDPVILNGRLKVNQGPGQKFFYEMEHVTLGVADGSELSPKRLKLEHMTGGERHPDEKDDMLAPSAAPRVTSPDETD